MSNREISQDSLDEDQLHDESNQLEEWKDDRWTINFQNTPKVILARLHLQPGEKVPGWFEECPLCIGRRCNACDGTGRMHPMRAMWIEDYLMNTAGE